MKELFNLIMKQRNDIPPEENWPDSWKTVYYKIYERGKTFFFEEKGRGELEGTILARKSATTFSGGSISLEKLLHLLRYSAGTHKEGSSRRVYASGGALYPIELYYINNLTSEDFERGIYHFNPRNNSLSLVRVAPTIPLSHMVGCGYEFIDQVSGLICFTAVPERVTEKYGWLGIRLCFFDIGQIIQSLSLLGEKFDLLYRPIAGFSHDTTDRLLNIDGYTETTLLIYAIGGKLNS
jgi:SagB-type dehydrogenase family enzyme